MNFATCLGILVLSAAFHDAYCNIDSRLYLVRKFDKNNYFCLHHEKSDIGSSNAAIYWKEISHGMVNLLIPEHKGCYVSSEFKRLGTFIMPGVNWVNRTSLEYEDRTFGLVLDYRWESLPMLTSEKKEYSLSNKVKLKELGISLWMHSNEKAKLQFGGGKFIEFDPFPAEVGFNGIKTKGWKIVKDEWNHFLVRFRNNQTSPYIKFYPTIKVIEISRVEKSFEVASLKFEANPGDFLKLHIVSTQFMEKSNLKFPVENDFCVLIPYYTDKNITIKSNNHEQIVKPTPTWQSLTLRHINTFINFEPQGFLAVGGLLKCEKSGVSLYMSEMIKKNQGSNLSCHLLGNNKDFNVTTVVEEKVGTHYMNFNTTGVLRDATCKAAGGQNSTSCKGVIVCSPKGCGCIKPFTGENCTEECSKENLSNYDCGKKCNECEGGCDYETGKCRGECFKGFRKPFCKDELLKFKSSPTVTSFDFEKDTAYVSILDAWNELTEEETNKINYTRLLSWSEYNPKFSILANVNPAEVTKTFPLPKLKNNTAYFVKAIIFEKTSEIYNRGQEPVMNFTYFKIEKEIPSTTPPPVEEKDIHDNITSTTPPPLVDKGMHENMLYLIAAIGVCIVTVIIGTICFCLNKRAPDHKRSNFSVRYSRAFPAQANAKDFEAEGAAEYNMTENNEYEALEFFKGKTYDCKEKENETNAAEESNIYEELPTDKKMDVLKFGKHVDKCMKRGLYKTIFTEIDTAIATNDTGYLDPKMNFNKTAASSATDKTLFVTFVEGYKLKHEFMMLGGPSLKQVNEFWRLVWDENINSIVVMEPFEMYWPKTVGTADEYGAIKVEFSSIEELCDFSTKTFTLTQQGETKTVRQFFFKSWSESDFPSSHISIPQFINKIYSHPNTCGPLLMQYDKHIERMGMIIFVDICTKMSADLGKLDPDGILKKLMNQNHTLFQNHKQYSFANMVLLEYLTANSSIACNKFSKVYKNSPEDKRFLKESFDDLNEQCKKDSACFELLNRGRVTNNAMGIPQLNGYKAENQFLVIARPKPLYMWALVMEHQVQQVIILNDVKDDYVPKENEPMKFGNNEFKLVEKGETGLYFSAIVQINDFVKEEYMAPTKYINVLILKNWPEGKVIGPSTKEMITFWEKSELQRNGPWSTLITCGDGATACGLYLSLGLVLEKMKLEQIIDIDLAIRMIRQKNPKFVYSIEQYKFLYDSVLEYKELNGEYCNFK